MNTIPNNIDNELSGAVINPTPMLPPEYEQELETGALLFEKPLCQTDSAKNLKAKEVVLKFKGLPPNAKAEDCALAKDFPHMNFPFEYFNPVQTQFLEEVPRDNNVVVCASTSAGKTVIGEMIASYTLSETRKTDSEATVAYIAPLKALCKEKEDDWTHSGHPFSTCTISILTGDYILTPQRKAELDKADIIAMSSEMLGSRIRRKKTEGTNFLAKIKILIIDEAHLITVPERGPNLESAIVKFTAANPRCRIVFLSATMPNVDELGSWLTALNTKPTTILKSNYRPVDLKWNYEYYEGGGFYAVTEKAKRACAIRTITHYSKDKFLLFVHSKKQGRTIQKELKDERIRTEFYNADVERDKRLEYSSNFNDRKPSGTRVLITTSSLAWGVNLCARRVFILGVHRGMSLVLPLDIVQMGGRAGRVGLDTEGDVHIAINTSNVVVEKAQCTNIGDIKSQINEMGVLGFHLVSEINEETVTDFNSACKWFSRTLSHHQNIMGKKEQTEKFIRNTIELLKKNDAISVEHVGGKETYRIKPVGRVSSWYYLSPFDVSWWKSNFRKIFRGSDPSKIELAWALANIPSTRSDFPLKSLGKEPTFKELTLLSDMGYDRTASVDKHTLAIYSLLTSKDPVLPEIRGMASGYRMDIDRKISAIKTLGNIGNYFDKFKGGFKLLHLPYLMRYGIASRGVELVMLPGIGYVMARTLMSTHRIFTAKDLVTSVRMGRTPLSKKVLAKAIPVAEEIAQVGNIAWLKRKNKNGGK